MPSKLLEDNAEVLSLLKDLEAYDNPQAYADPNEPHVYKLRVPGKEYAQLAPVLKIELYGTHLKSTLRTLLFLALKDVPNIEQLKESIGAKDLSEFQAKLVASEAYQQAELEMYLFLLRHFPALITRFFVIISQMALVSPTASLSAEDRKGFERQQKNLLESNLSSLRKDIKRMLRTRKRGGKSSTLDPDLRQSLHLTYDQLHSAAKTIKRHHDSLYKTFCAQRHRVGPKEWQLFWIEHATKVFDDHPRAFLELFAEADRPSASEVAYASVSQSIGLRESYVRKLVKELRKSSRSKKDVQTV